MKNQNDTDTSVIKTSEWVLTLLIVVIPLFGFIMLLIWAFGDNTNPNKANWAKAVLIWFAISASFSLFIFLIVGTAFLSASN